MENVGGYQNPRCPSVSDPTRGFDLSNFLHKSSREKVGSATVEIIGRRVGPPPGRGRRHFPDAGGCYLSFTLRFYKGGALLPGR